MIGLGVGVDYALLTVSAFRRALAREPSSREAARRALEEVRGTILCSGAAVATGFLALSLVRLSFLKALVFGGIVVVLAAVLATLTLLPALLALLGSRVNWPGARGSGTTVGGFWARWAQAVMRRPLLWSGLSLAVLALLIAPVFRMSGWNLGASTLGTDLEARQGYDILARDFAPGWIGPTAILLEAPPGRSVLDDSSRAAVRRLAERLSRDPRIAAVRGFSDLDAVLPAHERGMQSLTALPEPLRSNARDLVGREGRIAFLVLVGRDPPESSAAGALVRSLRSDPLPELAGTGLTARVTGTAAMLADFDREIFAKMWRVVPAVLLVTFIVLLVHLRSLLIPLKAMLLNLASVLASYGFLVFVFQDGHLAPLGLTPPGGLNAFIVLVVFTILFGLSMDYEVFLLTAIRREYLRSGNPRQAVAQGIARTGSLITSAAAIMISLFFAFACTRQIATREFGLGLAFAVAFDATLVRLVLLPALMALLGDANWWLPMRRRRNLEMPT
jgi:RND superfamily putative drug exporter